MKIATIIILLLLVLTIVTGCGYQAPGEELPKKEVKPVINPVDDTVEEEVDSISIKDTTDIKLGDII